MNTHVDTCTHAHRHTNEHACTRALLLRLAPEDASLAADAEELRAALGPADAAALKARGAARFGAGDHVGAVEAWGLLLGLPRSVGVPGALSGRSVGVPGAQWACQVRSVGAQWACQVLSGRARCAQWACQVRSVGVPGALSGRSVGMPGALSGRARCAQWACQVRSVGVPGALSGRARCSVGVPGAQWACQVRSVGAQWACQVRSVGVPGAYARSACTYAHLWRCARVCVCVYGWVGLWALGGCSALHRLTLLGP